MKIEELTEENVSALNNDEIKKLKDRFNQLEKVTSEMRENIEKSKFGKNHPVDQTTFFQKYRILWDEIQKRNLHTNLINMDKEIAKKQIQGIDVSEHLPILVDPDAVMLSGEFTKNHKNAETAPLFVSPVIDDEVRETIKKQAKKIVEKDVTDLDEITEEDSILSLYDLVLVPKTTKYQRIAKNKESGEEKDENTLIVEFDKKKGEKNFIKSEDRRLVGSIVYGVGEPDDDGDYIESREDIWKAMETWAETGHKMKFMHGGRQRDVIPVEIFQADADTKKGNDYIPKDSWYVTLKVNDDELWAGIKSGEITGLSMAGNGLRIPA